VAKRHKVTGPNVPRDLETRIAPCGPESRRILRPTKSHEPETPKVETPKRGSRKPGKRPNPQKKP